ncbi:MAG: hypothetical protein A2Y07_02235 [Planctomycetes bacterium GWF2_50_10]|nr:MAG: hypothetical protein A2Y07_02235 [Planctomycetes bacterium GWF2_50_10]
MRSSVFIALAAMLCAGPAFGSTIATFADPSTGSATPLFTVNTALGTVTGGWDDSKSGLTLIFPLTGNTYTNAFFILTNLAYSGTNSGGTTGPGAVSFYKDGEPVAAVGPLFMIEFASAQVSLSGLGGDDVFTLNDITLSGRELAGMMFEEEQFSFSFGNLKALPNKTGYTATASMTSSAIMTPEPMTIGLLAFGIGILTIAKKK